MSRFCERLSRFLEYLMATGLLVITVVVVLQVILSSVFNASITGANEIITKLFVYVTSIGAAVAVGRGEHIAITAAVDQMSPARRRSLQRLNLVMVGLLNLVVVAYSVHWVRITGNYLMPTTQLPRIVAQLSVPVGSALAVVFCCAELVQLRDSASQADGISKGVDHT